VGGKIDDVEEPLKRMPAAADVRPLIPFEKMSVAPL
jgi:hypothetical protein